MVRHGSDEGPATGLHGERMGKVDTAWLRMDSPTNRMMIVGVWVTRPGIAYDDLYQRLEQRLLQFPRFVERVVEDAAGATWVFDQNFDLSRHVVCEDLMPASGQGPAQALQDRIARLCVEPLERGRPLWQMHLIGNYEGGTALLIRIHHCIADGMALMAVMQSLVDGGTAPPVRHRKAMPAASHSAQEGFLESLFKPLAAMAVHALDRVARQGASEVGSLAYQAMADGAALALMEDDSHTSLKGIPGQAKRVAWCPALPLDEVKAVGRGLQCSINDVLLSCVAGAIGHYLQANGETVRGKEIRVMVPVNLRAQGDAKHLGNQFGLAPLVLPVGLENPIGRVYAVRRRMVALKDGLQPLMAFGMLAAAGVLAKPAQDALLGFFGKKTTAVITNVPGPQAKQRICGACIEEALFWVPQSGTVGLGISVFSYGGGVQFGILGDASLCPDPQKIVDRIAPEFNRLMTLTLMLPWGDQLDGL